MKELLEIHGFDSSEFSAAMSQYQADFGPQVRVLNIKGPVCAVYSGTKDGAWLEAMKRDLEAGLYEKSED
jgi:hypothetical protein